MKRKFATYCLGTVLGVLVTLGLFSFLLVGTTINKPVEPAPDYGAVRLSSFKNRPVPRNESQASLSESMPQVRRFQEIKMATPLMDLPSREPSLPGAEMDFTPSLAGTLPVGGLPSMAVAGGPASPGGGALTLGEVDEAPRAVFAPAPLYPAGTRYRDKKIRVVLRIILGKDGKVKKATALNPEPDLAPFYEAARGAVLQWRFTPGHKGGKPVACMADQPFSFSIDKN